MSRNLKLNKNLNAYIGFQSDWQHFLEAKSPKIKKITSVDHNVCLQIFQVENPDIKHQNDMLFDVVYVQFIYVCCGHILLITKLSLKLRWRQNLSVKETDSLSSSKTIS